MTTTLAEYIADLTDQFDQAELFFGHGTDNPSDEAYYLVFAALNLDFQRAATFAGRELTEAEVTRLDSLALRRIHERIPVAYLVGQAWFAGRPYYVNSDVLIPRSPIAELVQHRFRPMLKSAPTRILDLCTGSGCIGIACALAFPGAEVTLSDISPDALALAQRNAERHQVSERLQITESDLFSQLTGTWDLVVSNPPYVSSEEMAELPAEYQHEPALGLVSAEEGLAIPVAILQQAAEHLSDEGWLVLEVGYNWQALAERFPQVPFLWLSFESGGEGVLAISRAELRRWFVAGSN